MRTLKRIGSLLLAISLVLGTIPYVIAASDDDLFYERTVPIDEYAYSFAVVGDTQTHVEQDKLNGTKYTENLYKWIVDNKDEKNIQWVFGLGDITENRNYSVAGSDTEEWVLAEEAITQLDDAEIGYSLIPGNHDNISQFNTYFGPNNEYNNYAERVTEYYDESSIANYYINFEVAETKYMVLCMQYGPKDEVLEWASGVIEENSDRRVIVTTHMYLEKDGSLANEYSDWPPTNGNNGDEIWEKLVSKHRNIIMVLSGHLVYRNVGFSQQTGVYGNTVSQFLVDPQDSSNYKEGFVCMLYFTADGKEAYAEWISTVRTQEAQAADPDAEDILYNESNQRKFVVTELDDPRDYPSLSSLTVNGEELSLVNGVLEYEAAAVADTVGSVPVVAEASPEGATVTVSNADDQGNVALGEPGTTTTIKVAVTYEEITTTYTVDLYRNPAPWDSNYEPFQNIAEADAGSEDNPYEIANAKQLAFLSKVVRETVTVGDDTYSWSAFAGKHFELTSDIDLGANIAWEPIGNSTVKFRGTFDGKGHTIKGMYINGTKENQALFGYTQGTTVIKNLNITDASVTGYRHAAGFVGTGIGTLTLDNCSFSGAIDSTTGAADTNADADTAGLVGSFSSGSLTIEGCTVRADTTITTHSGTQLSWSYCGVGGILGAAKNADVTIRNSSSAASIVALGTGTDISGTGIGGVVGYARTSSNNVSLTMENCSSTGTISSSGTVGGLLGYMRTPDHSTNLDSTLTVTVDIDDCYAAVSSVTSGLIGGNYSSDCNLSNYTVTIHNSHFAGSAKNPIMAISTNTNKTVGSINLTVDNVYYLQGSATAANTVSNVVEKSASDFADGEVLALLNGERDVWMQGATYPIHKQSEPALGGLTLNGVSVDLTEWPTCYDQTVASTVDSIKVVATVANKGSGASISAVDSTGRAIEVSNDGSIAIKSGQTNVITITVFNNGLTKDYTVSIYREPEPWDGTMEPFENYDAEYAKFHKSVTGSIAYEIANAKQLAFLAYVVNYNKEGTTIERSQQGKSLDIDINGNGTIDEGETFRFPVYGGEFLRATSFVLTADIDLGGKDMPWTPIGSLNSTYFPGEFDGGDHKITNLFVNSSASYAGLFGYTTYQTTIKNLSVSGDVKTTGSYAGGIVGYTATNTATGLSLTNCTFSGTVTANRYAGGLVGGYSIWSGTPAFTFTNCYTTGEVKTTNSSSASAVGGLFGKGPSYSKDSITMTFTNCGSTMTVSAGNSAAGTVVAGLCAEVVSTTAYSPSLIFNNCFFAGTAVNSSVPIAKPSSAPEGGTVPVATATNVYYKAGSITGEATGVAATVRSAAEFADGTVTKALNAAVDTPLWATSVNGYPVLSEAAATLAAIFPEYAKLPVDMEETIVEENYATNIRADGRYSGIRFKFAVESTLQAENGVATMGGEVLEGLTELGVVMAKQGASSNATDLRTNLNLLETYAKLQGVLYQADSAGLNTFTSNDSDKGTCKQIRATLQGFAEEEAAYKRVYIARAYAKYTDADGQELIVYGDEIGAKEYYTSVYESAVALKKDSAKYATLTDDEKAYIKKVIDACGSPFVSDDEIIFDTEGMD